MFKLLVLNLILHIVFLSQGCSVFKKSHLEPTANSQLNSNVEKRRDAPERQANNLSEGELKEMILLASSRHGFAPLSKTAESDVFEVRMWINFGMPGDERFLVVQIAKERKEALFFESHDFKDSRKPPKQMLSEPQNGWEKLQSKLSKQLITPKTLVLDKDFFLDRHEGLISVDYAARGGDNFVFYGQHSSSEDALRLIGLCETLSDEFSLRLDCRGQRTRLGPIK